MSKSPLVIFVLPLTLGLVTLGCEDTPPTPAPVAGTTAAAASATAPPRPLHTPKVPQITPQTMKAYRVEMCFFGAKALRLARDNYLASLGGKDPGPDNLPNFGTFPDVSPAASAEPAPAVASAVPSAGSSAGDAPSEDPEVNAARLLAGGDKPPRPANLTLPFIAHLRNCTVAKSMKLPAFEGVDASLMPFESYVSRLQQALLETSRYYGGKAYAKDGFAKGKELHAKLTEMFPKLDEQLATFDEAVRAWYPKRLPEPETLDASGKLAQEALSQARALTLALLAGDSAKVDELRGKLEASRDALAKRAKEAASEPHGRFVTPRIDPLLRAASVSAPLDGAKEYALTAAFADLVEANHRSLAQLLRMRGDMMPGVSGPLRGGGSPHGKLPH